MIRYVLASLIFFFYSLPLIAGQLWLLAPSTEQAENCRQQLLLQTSSYLVADRKIQVTSFNKFRQKYPLYVLPPAGSKDIVYLLQANNGIFLTSEILQQSDKLLLLFTELNNLEERQQKILQANQDGATILKFAYLAYTSGKKQTARRLLFQALKLQLYPQEKFAAQKLQNLLDKF